MKNYRGIDELVLMKTLYLLITVINMEVILEIHIVSCLDQSLTFKGAKMNNDMETASSRVLVGENLRSHCSFTLSTFTRGS